jgi:peptidoglycan/xylan/chitin deacetylase (PgdA/CDA1 family)
VSAEHARMAPESPVVGTRDRQAYVTTSWDDGHVLDFAVANLLDRYGLPGTFYIAPRNRELPPAERLADRDISALGERFEIGGHTLRHRRLSTISDREAREEIVAGKEYLEECVGRALSAFCYPGGAYSPRHRTMVAESGFSLARTIERHRTEPPTELFDVATTFHAYRHLRDGAPAFAMADHRPRRAIEYFVNWDLWAIDLFERVRSEGGVFHLWGHSWEISARADWKRLEKVLAHIAGRTDVTYIDNGSLAHLGRTANAAS